MSRLVLLNGAPASGKSTLARRYADEHPLVLALDLDVLRGLLGGWLERPADSGVIARRMALALARLSLTDGRDVLVPQFLGRIDFVLQLDELCREVGAEFVEIALLSDPQDAAERFLRRSRESGSGLHRDAAAMQERLGGTAELTVMYARLLDVVARRPGTRTIRTVNGEVEAAYRDLLGCLGEHAPPEPGPPATDTR